VDVAINGGRLGRPLAEVEVVDAGRVLDEVDLDTVEADRRQALRVEIGGQGADDFGGARNGAGVGLFECVAVGRFVVGAGVGQRDCLGAVAVGGGCATARVGAVGAGRWP
jgi:hypothetical protein